MHFSDLLFASLYGITTDLEVVSGNDGLALFVLANMTKHEHFLTDLVGPLKRGLVRASDLIFHVGTEKVDDSRLGFIAALLPIQYLQCTTIIPTQDSSYIAKDIFVFFRVSTVVRRET